MSARQANTFFTVNVCDKNQKKNIFWFMILMRQERGQDYVGRQEN